MSKPEMPRSSYVLCRRDLSNFGEAARYCCKPINAKTAPNVLDWCDDCRARLPIWARGVVSESDVRSVVDSVARVDAVQSLGELFAEVR